MFNSTKKSHDTLGDQQEESNVFRVFSEILQNAEHSGKKGSWFPTTKEREILADYEAAIPTNTKKSTTLGLAVSSSTVYYV